MSEHSVRSFLSSGREGPSRGPSGALSGRGGGGRALAAGPARARGEKGGGVHRIRPGNQIVIRLSHSSAEASFDGDLMLSSSARRSGRRPRRPLEAASSRARTYLCGLRGGRGAGAWPYPKAPRFAPQSGAAPSCGSGRRARPGPRRRANSVVNWKKTGGGRSAGSRILISYRSILVVCLSMVSLRYTSAPVSTCAMFSLPVPICGFSPLFFLPKFGKERWKGFFRPLDIGQRQTGKSTAAAAVPGLRLPREGREGEHRCAPGWRRRGRALAARDACAPRQRVHRVG